MEKKQTEERLRKILIPLCAEDGLQLWGLSLTGKAGHRKKLRIFIDSDQGVSIDQCTAVSRELSIILDAEEIIPDSYILEVSSPGLERLFFTLDQLPSYIGETLKVECLAGMPGQKNFTGKLISVGKNDFLLEIDGQDTTIKWDTVKKARLVYPFTIPTT